MLGTDGGTDVEIRAVIALRHGFESPTGAVRDVFGSRCRWWRRGANIPACGLATEHVSSTNVRRTAACGALRVALSALIAAGFAVAIGVDWYGVYAETHGPFMPLVIGAAFLISSGVAFFAWANGAAQRQHAGFTAEDVQSAIENCLDLHADDDDEWDLFLGFSIDDPYLESVRQRCIRMWDERGPEPVSPSVRDELEKMRQELRTRA